MNGFRLAEMKHHDQKQLTEERVCVGLLLQRPKSSHDRRFGNKRQAW